MKLISLNCNHCGAPLEVSPKANFATCSFCEARLAIERTGSSYSTAILEELQQTTQSLAADVRQMKHRSAIEDLDRQWQMEKENYMIRGKEGRMSVPTKAGAIVGGVFLIGFGVFWMLLAGFGTAAVVAGGGPPVISCFPLVGLAVVVVGIFTLINGYGKAEKFESAQRNYRLRRHELMSRDH